MNIVYLLKKKRLVKTTLDKLSPADASNCPMWIDLNSADLDELQHIAKLFHIHPLNIEDMSKKLTRPKAESFDNYSFIVLYGLYMEQKVKVMELDFILGRKFVISNHFHNVRAFDDLMKDEEKIHGLLEKGSDFMLHHLIDLEVDNYSPIINVFDDELEALENRAVSNPSPEHLAKLFNIKRQLLRIRKVVYPEKDVLFNLAKRNFQFVSEKAVAYFRDVYDHIIRVNDQIDNYREIISSILEVHLSVTSNKLNEVMKVLTIITVLLMPITAIGAIYGMNFKFMPELEWHFGYFAALLFMVSITIIMYVYIRKKKWI